MPSRSIKVKAGDRVNYENRPVTVLQVKGSTVQIRNTFGYPQDVKKSELTEIKT